MEIFSFSGKRFTATKHSLNCNAVVHRCPMNVNSKLKSVNYASINYKKIVWSNYYVRLMLHFKLLCV